jgi:hypothetical protein
LPAQTPERVVPLGVDQQSNGPDAEGPPSEALLHQVGLELVNAPLEEDDRTSRVVPRAAKAVALLSLDTLALPAVEGMTG